LPSAGGACHGRPAQEAAVAAGTVGGRGSLSLWQIFRVFLKAGLAFGGGLAILAVLEEELVTRRRLIGRDEFLAIYGIGRIVPSGTMTAVAVALGHRFAGHKGVAVALVALVLPGFLSTVALAAAYRALAHGPVLSYLSATLLPASLALILVSTVRLGREIFRPSLELALAAAGLAGALFLHLGPAFLLIAGGLVGAVAFGGRARP
jgi:chromate transporter